MKSSSLALLFLAQNAHAFSASSYSVLKADSALGSHHKTRLFNAPRHDVRSGGNVEMDPEEMKLQAALAEHQQNAVSLSGMPLI